MWGLSDFSSEKNSSIGEEGKAKLKSGIQLDGEEMASISDESKRTPGANHTHTQAPGKILFSWSNAQFIKIPSAFSLNEEISLLT